MTGRDHRQPPDAERAPEQGAVLILSAAAMVLLMVLLALTVDIGNAAKERRRSQNGADAAALAGAQDIASGDLQPANVVGVIEAYVARNVGTTNWIGCSDPSALPVHPDPGETCISWDQDPPLTTAVRVAAPTRSVTTMFGGLVGLATVPVHAIATASVGHPSSVVATPCALCTLGNTNLNVSGDIGLQNGNVVVTGGGVYVGGNLSCGPHGSLTSPSNGVVGTISSSCGLITPAAVPVAAIADPFATLPATPDSSQLTAHADCTNAAAAPGIYTNITGCTLAPGLYVVAGGTIGGDGLSAVTGLGVTIFLTCGTATQPHPCAAGEQGATADIGGNGAATLTACSVTPCVGGATKGLVIWYDRNDAATMVAHGNGLVNVVGTVYGKAVTIDVKGTPAGTAGLCLTGFCSDIVVQQVVFSGQGTLNVAYVPGANLQIIMPAAITQLSG